MESADRMRLRSEYQRKEMQERGESDEGLLVTINFIEQVFVLLLDGFPPNIAFGLEERVS